VRVSEKLAYVPLGSRRLLTDVDPLDVGEMAVARGAAHG
jgi:hypothetical protein